MTTSSIFDLFKKEETKVFLTEIIKPVANIVFNELYIYIWIICIYNVFLFFVVLAILILICRTHHSNE
jgi:hypothetical protein